MADLHLLCPIGMHELGPRGGDERVLVFGVPGRQHSGPSLRVHVQTLRVLIDQLPGRVERLVFVEGSAVDSATAQAIEDMLAAMGPEDGLVRFQIPAEAIKLVKIEGDAASAPSANRGTLRFIERGIDRATLLAFCPPEVLRVSSLARALLHSPVGEWVDPAGLVASHAGLIETYPPDGLQT